MIDNEFKQLVEAQKQIDPIFAESYAQLERLYEDEQITLTTFHAVLADQFMESVVREVC